MNNSSRQHFAHAYTDRSLGHDMTKRKREGTVQITQRLPDKLTVGMMLFLGIWKMCNTMMTIMPITISSTKAMMHLQRHGAGHCTPGRAATHFCCTIRGTGAVLHTRRRGTEGPSS